jgi:hypothetical protein
MFCDANNPFLVIHASAVGIGAGPCRNRRRLSLLLCPPFHNWTCQESRESRHSHGGRSISRQYSRPNRIAAPEGKIEAFETQCCTVKYCIPSGARVFSQWQRLGVISAGGGVGVSMNRRKMKR